MYVLLLKYANVGWRLATNMVDIPEKEHVTKYQNITFGEKCLKDAAAVILATNMFLFVNVGSNTKILLLTWGLVHLLSIQLIVIPITMEIINLPTAAGRLQNNSNEIAEIYPFIKAATELVR